MVKTSLGRRILHSLDQLAQKNRIAIYGSGKIGHGFKGYMEKLRPDLEVVFYIDTFRSGTRDSLPILPLGEVESKRGQFDTILVCSTAWDEIEEMVVEKGYEFYIISNELMYETVDIRSLGTFRFPEKQRSEMRKRLEKVSAYFDGSDREYFSLLADLRLSDDESSFFDFLKGQYKNFGIPYLYKTGKELPGPVILEGGVADGGDSVAFYDYFTNKHLKIYGFEPFIEAFNQSNNKTLLSNLGMEIFPNALWDSNVVLNFNKNPESANTSSIARSDNSHQQQTENTVAVNGQTIDSFVEDRRISDVGLIKLDIEGAETEALKGAEKTIRSQKPRLAISIYHKKEHLYEIPELLKQFNADYKFQIGFYGPTFIDVVLYAFI